MNRFLDMLEEKIRKRAVPHLTAVMIGCFIVGYLVSFINQNALNAMNLNIHMVLKGQVWRIVTWVLMPPSDPGLFTVIMLFFYFSIGVTLERVWGDAKYNIYLLGGIIISIAAAFISYFIMRAFYPGVLVGLYTGLFFKTYNICMSILLAYAATFPDATVLLMFVIPLKMKYLGWIYGAYIAYDCYHFIRLAIEQRTPLYLIYVIAIAASLVNFVIFFLWTRRGNISPKHRKRQMEFRRAVNRASQGTQGPSEPVNVRNPRHRCETCGRTDISDPDMEFRYCSKCRGEHEYCMEHLKTHIHIEG